MKLARLGFLLISIFTMSYVHAELLVIKKTGQGFAPLDASDEKNKVELAQIFLDYEWPMVIANTKLTKEEMDELLTADKPNAEEDFIRAKVKEVNPNYDVVFVPTSMYELFTLTQVGGQYRDISAGEVGSNPFETVFFRYLRKTYGYIWLIDALGRRDQPLKHGQTMQESYGYMFDKFRQYNNDFYPDAFFYINNALMVKLFELIPALGKIDSAHEIAAEIHTNISKIVPVFIRDMTPWVRNKSRLLIELDNKNKDILDSHGVLARAIELEYKAQAANKALLWRGTSLIELSIAEHKHKLIGSTLKTRASLKELGQRKDLDYAISYGNSLFAGIINDPGACAYNYIRGEDRYSTPYGGYALFIDKKYHIKNLYAGTYKSLDLFYISPASTLLGLLAQGDFFHSRTKAAIPFEEQWKAKRIGGFEIVVGDIIDPFGILTAIRDPLVHAELFSKYLAKNMRVISIGDEANLTPVERKIYENKLAEAQLKAGQYYKAIRTLEPFAKSAAQRVRKKLAEKKLAEQAKGQE